MNRDAFIAAIKGALFGGRLTSKQIDGINAILDEADCRGTSPERLAYIFATAHWETGRKMQPVAEIGRGKGRTYGKPAGPYGKIYYGRGHVQLTWLHNYEKAGRLRGLDLVRNPELALDLRHSINIMFSGMEAGWFTGKKLADFFGKGPADWRNARKIINGLDKADLIGGHAKEFLAALTKAGYGAKAAGKPADAQKPVEAPNPAPKPQPAPAAPADGNAGFVGKIVAVIVAACTGTLLWLGGLLCELPDWIINLVGLAGKCGG